jgi:RNA polymerase sigma factor (sigma-70 family)
LVISLTDLPHNPPSPETLEEAYQRYRLELRRFFKLNSHDTPAVDDLIQAMYLSIRKTRPQGEVRDPRQYLFRAAWNLLHTENRRVDVERAQSVPCTLEEFDTYAEQSNRLWVEDDTVSELQENELNRVLSQLPRACQFALLRQYRDNRTYREIAAEMGVTPHAVKKYIRRALTEFREHFNSKDIPVAQEGKRRP